MMLDHLGRTAEAAAIEAAVAACVREGAATADVGGSLTTSQAGDAVLQRLRFDRPAASESATA